MSTNQPQAASGQPDTDQRGGNRKWPWPARLAMTILLAPVWCGVLICVEGDLSSYGLWITILSGSLFIVIAAVIWVTTARSQK
jgi:hypothetical protein